MKNKMKSLYIKINNKLNKIEKEIVKFPIEVKYTVNK